MESGKKPEPESEHKITRPYFPGRKWSKKKELAKRLPEKPYVIETDIEKIRLACPLC